MGTTAQKIQYLDGTKTLLKDTINLTGAGITNDTFRSYANKLKLGLINALNDNGDTIYSNLEKVSGKGSNLSLTPTYEAPMRNREIYGNTLQNGTPTPSSPVPIQSVTGLQNVTISNSDNTDSNTYEVNLGKNLLNAGNGRLGTFGTLTISYSNGEILLNGNSSSNVDFYVGTNVSTPTYNKELLDYMNSHLGTYTLSNNLGFENYFRIGSSYPQNTGTITSTNKVDLIFVRIPAGTYNNKVLNIQLEKGSQTTSYSPYFTPYEFNGIGDYDDSIKKSTGKNLFDIQSVIKGRIDNGIVGYESGTSVLTLNNDNFSFTTTANYRGATSSLIPVNPSTIYYYKETSSSTIGHYLDFYDNNGTWISRSSTIAGTSLNEFSFTTLSNAYYIRLSYLLTSSSTITINQPQLEQNSQATSYEPYGKVWYITENIGEVVLNGTESDSTYNTGTTGSFTRFGYLPFMNTDVCKIQSDYVSNYFKYLGTIGGDTTEAGISNTSVSGLNRLFIFLPTSTASTIAQFKTWLSTHNTEIKYIKATPTYTVITNTELIEQLETLYNAKSKNGTTNINVTSEDLAMILNVSVIKGDA